MQPDIIIRLSAIIAEADAMRNAYYFTPTV